jgi:hypothetical protein
MRGRRLDRRPKEYAKAAKEKQTRPQRNSGALGVEQIKGACVRHGDRVNAVGRRLVLAPASLQLECGERNSPRSPCSFFINPFSRSA